MVLCVELRFAQDVTPPSPLAGEGQGEGDIKTRKRSEQLNENCCGLVILWLSNMGNQVKTLSRLYLVSHNTSPNGASGSRNQRELAVAHDSADCFPFTVPFFPGGRGTSKDITSLSNQKPITKA
jgi:hypothetical protein